MAFEFQLSNERTLDEVTDGNPSLTTHTSTPVVRRLITLQTCLDGHVGYFKNEWVERSISVSCFRDYKYNASLSPACSV